MAPSGRPARPRWAWRLPALLVLALVQPTARAERPTPGAADFDVVGHQNRPQQIQLKAALAIPDEGEMQLPILVDPPPIAVWGDGPPKVVAVSSQQPDGIYGVGEKIALTVRFTSPVLVLGNMSQLGLTVTTGCHDAACATREVQTLVCYADYGKFALSFRGESVANIDALADPEVRPSIRHRPSARR